MVSNLKFRVKINERELAITILNFKIEINVITCKVANRFSLTIKRQSKILIIVYNGNALIFFKIYKNMKIVMSKIRIL